MTTENFLPETYEAPKGSSNYMKLSKGENRFRILSKPIIGWEDWKDKKPIRFAMNEKPSSPIDPKKPIKHFWAMVVWNAIEEKVQILEITQSTIQGAIQNLSKDSDWGSPFEYDIKITRSGDGMETEYTINPVPHKPVTEEIKKAYFDKQPIDLTALFSGGDPFEQNAAAAQKSDLPF